jgi:hypothetical protein
MDFDIDSFLKDTFKKVEKKEKKKINESKPREIKDDLEINPFNIKNKQTDNIKAEIIIQQKIVTQTIVQVILILNKNFYSY